MASATDNIVALNAITATGTTTSSGYDLSIREAVSVQFTASSITVGNGVFSIDASNDGTNWVTGIAFIDATSTTPATYVTNKTLSSNTSAMVYLPSLSFRLIRVKVVVTTDGTYSATIEARG